MTQTYQSHNTLYFDPLDIKSHACRMLVAFKNIQADLIPVKEEDVPQALLEANPYGSTPTWVDREVVVYEPRTIFEYLEERYPAPSLLPAVPSQRAQIRMLLYRIDKDWLTRVRQLSLREKPETRSILAYLSDSLTSIAPAFEKYPYFMSETMTFADCLLLALLWRLPTLGVALPKPALPLAKYAQRLFKESFFQQSLTPQERQLNAQAPQAVQES